MMVQLQSLYKIANEMRRFAQTFEHWAPEDAKRLNHWANELDTHHDHADPCNDENCPCFAVGYKARAEDRDAFFAAKRARRSE